MNITVDTIFNAINLAVRIGLVVYVIKKYVINSVVSAINIEKQDQIDLKNKEAQLVCMQHKIAEQIEQDQQLFQQLQVKFQIWEQKVQKHLEQQQLICQQRQEYIYQSLLERTAYLQQQSLIKTEVPALLDTVALNLKEQFAQDRSLGKKFNQKLLQTLYE